MKLKQIEIKDPKDIKIGTIVIDNKSRKYVIQYIWSDIICHFSLVISLIRIKESEYQPRIFWSKRVDFKKLRDSYKILKEI